MCSAAFTLAISYAVSRSDFSLNQSHLFYVFHLLFVTLATHKARPIKTVFLHAVKLLIYLQGRAFMDL